MTIGCQELSLPLTQRDLRQDYLSILNKRITVILLPLRLQAAAQRCAEPCFALLQGNLRHRHRLKLTTLLLLLLGATAECCAEPCFELL
jgi:hypothetical protein